MSLCCATLQWLLAENAAVDIVRAQALSSVQGVAPDGTDIRLTVHEASGGLASMAAVLRVGSLSTFVWLERSLLPVPGWLWQGRSPPSTLHARPHLPKLLAPPPVPRGHRARTGRREAAPVTEATSCHAHTCLPKLATSLDHILLQVPMLEAGRVAGQRGHASPGWGVGSPQPRGAGRSPQHSSLRSAKSQEQAGAWLGCLWAWILG